MTAAGPDGTGGRDRPEHDPAADESDLLTRREAAARLHDELAELRASGGDAGGHAARIAVLERAITRLRTVAPVRLR